MELAFDIGANLGTKLNVILSRAKKVVAFEPHPEVYPVLKDACQHIPNVIVDNRALSDQIGEKVFSMGDHSQISTFSSDWMTDSRFTKFNHTWYRKVAVNTTTLDSIIEEYGIPNYVKIDVEGYEYEVLTGLTKLIPNCVFSFEWAEECKDSIIKSFNHLTNLGYNKFDVTRMHDEVKFDDQLEWKSLDDLNFIESLDRNRMDAWGMIYFKVA